MRKCLIFAVVLTACAAAQAVLIDVTVSGTGSLVGSYYTDLENNQLVQITVDTSGAGGYGTVGTITQGTISGPITVSSADMAACLLTWAGTHNITGGITGDLTATSASNSAYGIHTGSGSITIANGISGNITTTGDGIYIFGLSGSIGNVNITGGISGDIVSDCGSGYLSRAIHAWDPGANGLVSVSGDISGQLRATGSGLGYCYTIYGNHGVTLEDISGSIIADTSTGVAAYAVYADAGNVDVGSISGDVTAEAKDNSVRGLIGHSVTVDGITSSGSVTAESTNLSDAIGIHASVGSVDVEGEMAGTVSATTNTSAAYAIRGETNLVVQGELSGTVSATAGTDLAGGLVAQNGTLNGGDTSTALTVTGSVTAEAGSTWATAIGAYDRMNVKIDGGTVSATVGSGSEAYAVRSGVFAGGQQSVVDTLEITAGSTIVGQIDLAGGTDTLTLSGTTGSTTLASNVRNIENIVVSGGNWYLNGTLTGNTNGISMSGGLLGGTGSFGDIELTGGTLAPGNSIGTLPIDGDLTLGSGSTLQIEVNNSGQADKITVTGTATLDGTLQAVPDGVVTDVFSATIIDAETGLSGSFATLDTALLDFSVIYNTSTYDVIMTVNSNYFLVPAKTDNQRSLANALDSLSGTSGDISTVLMAIQGIGDSETLRKAYAQLYPQVSVAMPEISMTMSQQYSGSLFARMREARTNRAYGMDYDWDRLYASLDDSQVRTQKTKDKWNVFMKGFGIFGTRERFKELSGYEYNIYGTAVGADRLVRDDLLVGVGFGMSKANVSYMQPGTGSDIDTMFASLYGSWFDEDWHVDATFSYGHSWYESNRGINFSSISRKATSEHEGDSFGAALEVGRIYGKTFRFEPVAGIGYTYLREDGYTEKGADSLNLTVDAADSQSMYSKLGFNVDAVFRSEENPAIMFMPKLGFFWLHEFADAVELNSTFAAGGTSFTTEGYEPEEDRFNLRAGLNFYYPNDIRLFLHYDWFGLGDLSSGGSDFEAHVLQGGVQFKY